MPGQHAAAAANAGLRIITSRFGELAVDTTKSIAFPRGLLGLPEKANYVIANFPSEKMQQFKILQSLDDDALAFIVLPLDTQNAILTEADIRTASLELQIDEANLAVMMVVSVHRSPDAVRLSVNARAPLFVDVERRVGTQYVFQSDRYLVQHYIN